jgi:hypothetical protein
MYHCGSRVRVGVKVAVGRGVSEGGIVGVLVGKDIGVIVAGGCDSSPTAVTSGSGLDVQIGSNIGVGVVGTISLNPPHPIRKSASPVIQKTIFFVIASLQRFDYAPQRTFVAPLSEGQLAMTEL